ncbi:MAG: RNase III, dsRNA [uncultured bacterium]|nr:MAG: RNase III, dsRNA [uncultured bacterium]
MRHKALFEILGYSFQNMKLLERALRHRSMGKVSNERLEFLGDAALNFIIAAELFHRYPDMKEGDLSRLRANLVNGDVLADLAGELHIGDHLQFGSGELRSGGAKRKSIIADATEAIIGAMYLDGGFEVVQRRVLSWFSKRLDEAAGVAQKDPKTLLQELLQMRKIPLPAYTVVSTTGVSHSQVFTIKCAVSGVDEAAIGIGPNKRRAERDAAEKMLARIEKTN